MMKKYIQNLLDSTPGLLAVIITDKDGVVILKACCKDYPELSQCNSFIVPFVSASDQASKLGLGKNKTIACFYDNFQVVSHHKGGVLVHLVGAADGNTGDLLTLDDSLHPLLPPLEELVNAVTTQVEV